MSRKNNPNYIPMMREEKQAKLAAKGIVKGPAKLAKRIDTTGGGGNRSNAKYSAAVNRAHRCGCPPCAAFARAARELRQGKAKSTKAARKRLLAQREPCRG